MANMMDYLAWRGDLTFSQDGFHEVDNLIFSELVYVDFSGIVPSDGRTIPLKEASEKFFSCHTEEEIEAKVSSTKMAAFLMREMAKTKRFGNLLLSYYIEEISREEESQFCAMTVYLDDKSTVVTYSGTDNTIVGWKENFNMSFLSETPGQLKAIEYLEQAAGLQKQGAIRVMGHSKGGNLAVYAAVHADEEVQKRITAVYSNDGPGFTSAMLEKSSYRKMLPRIRTIMPESSIVGMLLEHEEEYEVVKSSGSGPMQHDAMTWEVLGNALVHVRSVTEQSRMLDKTLKSWIGGMDREKREEFVDTLFAVLQEAEIETVDDLANMKWKKFIELMKIRSTLDKENADIMAKTLHQLFKESNQTLLDAVRQKTINKI